MHGISRIRLIIRDSCGVRARRADRSLGLGLIGTEGMLGNTMMFGNVSLQLQTMVPVPGHAWRISRLAFFRPVKAAPALQRRLASYTCPTLDFLMQNAFCIRIHRIEARLGTLVVDHP